MGRNLLLLLVQLCLLLFNIFRFLDATTHIDSISLFNSICIAIASIIFFFLFWETKSILRNQIFRISYLFLIGYFIVHFQVYVDYILGNYQHFTGDYLLYPSAVTKTAIISCIGLNSFFAGYLFKSLRTAKFQNSDKTNLKHKPSKYLLLLSWAFFILFLLFANKDYFQGQYGVVELGLEATYLQTYFLYFISAYIIVKAYNLKLSERNLSVKKYLFYFSIYFLILIASYSVLVVISGDRGPLIQIVLLIMAGYIFTQKTRIKSIYFIVGIIFSTFLITTLGQIRAVSSETSFIDKYKQSKISSTRENFYSISPYTHELAISVRTAHGAVDLMDRQNPKYGLVQLNQLSAIVPGLGLAVREISGAETKDLASADILTYYILGNFPSHGLGTSCIADIYLDFKIYGVIIGFLLFGIFIRFIEVNSFTLDVPKLLIWIMAFVFIAKAIYIGRSSIVILFRECFIIYFFIWLGSLKKQ